MESGICNFCKNDKKHFCLNNNCENYKYNLIKKKINVIKKLTYKHFQNKLNHFYDILKNLQFMSEYIENNKSFYEKQLENFNYDENMNNLDLNLPIKTSNYEIINDLNTYDYLITHIKLSTSPQKILLEKYLYYRKYQIIQSISQLD